MEVNESNKRKTFWKAIKIVTVIICLFGFGANSYLIFVQFIKGQTVTSYNINQCSKYNCILPSITICGLSGLKQKIKNYTDLEYNKYINNTANLNEMVESIFDMNGNKLTTGPLGVASFNESLWKVSTVYSLYRGRCYTIEYKKEVKKPV